MSSSLPLMVSLECSEKTSTRRSYGPLFVASSPFNYLPATGEAPLDEEVMEWIASNQRFLLFRLLPMACFFFLCATLFRVSLVVLWPHLLLGGSAPSLDVVQINQGYARPTFLLWLDSD